ncbi:MAG TPA: polysaccharide deacetylase family protein [Solirubrobacteraceae bacterium]|nr:polysaccharide deacetylase family protein [Solirubrobacteraceae bacterium]
MSAVDSEASRARREAARRAARRRRRALGALALSAVVAVVAVLVATSGGRTRAHGVGAHAAAASAGPRAQEESGGAGASSASASAVGPPRSTPVPILMYHVIAAPPPGAPFPGLYVTPSEFAEQMHALSAAGWRATTLDRLAAYWRGSRRLGAGKPIVLTFDNGYQSQYTQAFPVLRSLGWVADENIQLSGLPPSQGGLGEREVREMVAAGWELDTQGFSHADLVALGPEQLHYQVAVARETLRRRYHVAVNWFCYPSGHYDATVIAAVRSAGYVGSTTVIPGWAHPSEDPYRLHRLRVLGGTSPPALEAQIASAEGEGPAPASYGA